MGGEEEADNAKVVNQVKRKESTFRERIEMVALGN